MQVELSTITKIISSICGIIIIIMSISRFAGLNVGNPRAFILTIHFMLRILKISKNSFYLKIKINSILGGILVLAEFRVNYVLRNFGLLKGLFGRGLYAIL